MTVRLWKVVTYILTWAAPVVFQGNRNPGIQLPIGLAPRFNIPNPCVGAVYFMSNDPIGNHVIVNCIHPDGKLSFSSAIPTTGKGLYGNNSPALNSANSMITVGRNLFVVNAGSNSIAMFEINPTNPTKLNLINIAASGGISPVALAYSDKMRMLCVANGGSVETREGASVLCFTVTQQGMTPLPNTYKKLHLKLGKPIHGTIADEVSDIIFTADSKYVLVSAKNSAVFAFPVQSSEQLGDPIKNTVGKITYSMSLIPGSKNQVLHTDPGFGLGIFELGNDGRVLDSVQINIPGQQLSCWSEFSPSTGSLFSVDFITNFTIRAGAITEVKLNPNPNMKGLPTAEIIQQYKFNGPLLDARIASLPTAGEFLYVLNGTPGSFGVHVLRLGKPGAAKVEQTLIPNVTLSEALAGLAVYVK